MEKTANYGLPKWEKSDFIKMDDFNAAFGKIDETLKASPDLKGIFAVSSIGHKIAGYICERGLKENIAIIGYDLVAEFTAP